MKTFYVLAAVLLSSAAFAAPPKVDPPKADQPLPTVTLTRAQLEALVAAENTRAVGEYINQEKSKAAADAYHAVQAAFAPPAAPSPEPAPTPGK